MLKSLLTTTALVALLAGGSAVAQTQSGTDGTSAQPNPAVEGDATMNNAPEGTMEQSGEATEPSTTDPASAMTDEAEDAVESTEDAVESTADSVVDSDTDSDAMDTQTSAATAGDVGGFVTMQDQSEVLATTFMGQDVVNSQDETIGKINDLVMTDDGRVTAAVIGVGGFLGIGEKNVGVPLDSIEIRSGEGNDVQLVMQSTREELEAAPEFADLDEQMRTQEAAQPPAAGEGGMTSQPSTTGTAN